MIGVRAFALWNAAGVFINGEPLTGNREPLTGNREPLTGNREPLTGNREPLSGNREPLTGNREPLTGNREPLTGNREPLTGNREPITGNHEPITGNHEPLTGNHGPITGNHGPVTGNREPLTGNREPVTGNREPVTRNHGPVTGNREPNTRSSRAESREHRSLPAPLVLTEGPLAPWPDDPSPVAPPIAKRTSSRPRRPHRSAQLLVRLASALLDGARPNPLAIVLGTACGSFAADRSFDAQLRERGTAFGSPSLFVYTLPSAAAGELAIELGSHGPAFCVSAGESSALASIAAALELMDQLSLPHALCGQLELGIPDEQIALFWLERGAHRALRLRPSNARPTDEPLLVLLRGLHSGESTIVSCAAEELTLASGR